MSVTALACNPAGNLLFSGSKDKTVQTWDLVSKCPVATLSGNMKEIPGLECSLCGSMLAIANRSVLLPALVYA